MRISKRSWHYRFLEWMDLKPIVGTGPIGYGGLLLLGFFWFMFYQWWAAPINYLLRNKNKPIDFYDK